MDTTMPNKPTKPTAGFAILKEIKAPDSVPEHMRKVLGLLMGEAHDLRLVFLTFQGLYKQSEGNIPLLEKTAPRFFGLISGVLLEHLIIGIARFTDPEMSGDKRNLTLRALFEKEKPPELDQLHQKSGNIRVIRNKIIAHLDWEAGLMPNEYLKQVSYSEIRELTELIETIAKKAWTEWTGNHFVFDESLAPDILDCLARIPNEWDENS
jgi:hypothetical protein